MIIQTQPLTADAFAPFGNVLETTGKPTKMINQGMCGRYHDLADLDFHDGVAGISVFDATPRQLPYALDLMERHPEGSQAFIPMSFNGFLITVAPDIDGSPGKPLAFVSKAGQGINLFRGVWHGVLTPLQAPGLFAVVDRIGDGANLQEHHFEVPYTIQ